MRPRMRVVVHRPLDRRDGSRNALRLHPAQIALQDLVHRLDGRVGEDDILLRYELGDFPPRQGLK